VAGTEYDVITTNVGYGTTSGLPVYPAQATSGHLVL
jgi:hypothetical protein